MFHATQLHVLVLFVSCTDGVGGGRGCMRCLVTHVGCYGTAHTCFMLRNCMCSYCSYHARMGWGVGVVACVVLSLMLDATELRIHVSCYATAFAHTCTHASSGFFDRFRPGSTVHADGNREWKSEAQRRSIKFASVAHNKMQFTKRHSKTRLTGAQALDKVWSHLKRSVPKSLCSRSKSDRRFNPRMEQYVYSYMWRFNDRNWWKQLGELCKQR